MSNGKGAFLMFWGADTGAKKTGTKTRCRQQYWTSCKLKCTTLSCAMQKQSRLKELFARSKTIFQGRLKHSAAYGTGTSRKLKVDAEAGQASDRFANQGSTGFVLTAITMSRPMAARKQYFTSASRFYVRYDPTANIQARI